MNEPRDPVRLLEGADSAFLELEAGLRKARARGPSTEQRARIGAALGLPAASEATSSDDRSHGPETAGSAGTAQVTAAPRPRATGYPWLRLAVLAALGVGAVFAAQIGKRSTTRAPVPSASDKDAQPRQARVAVEPHTDLPSTQHTEAEPAAPIAEPALQRHRRAVGTKQTAVQADQVIDPSAELALLKRAKANARSAPDRALTLLAEHERRFAHGALVQEREVIAIEALLAAGERTAAEQRAARFFQDFPDSAHARRVRALLRQREGVDSDAKSTGTPHSSR
jgi:hypothetical protein